MNAANTRDTVTRSLQYVTKLVAIYQALQPPVDRKPLKGRAQTEVALAYRYHTSWSSFLDEESLQAQQRAGSKVIPPPLNRAIPPATHTLCH